MLRAGPSRHRVLWLPWSLERKATLAAIVHLVHSSPGSISPTAANLQPEEGRQLGFVAEATRTSRIVPRMEEYKV